MREIKIYIYTIFVLVIGARIMQKSFLTRNLASLSQNSDPAETEKEGQVRLRFFWQPVGEVSGAVGTATNRSQHCAQQPISVQGYRFFSSAM